MTVCDISLRPPHRFVMDALKEKIAAMEKDIEIALASGHLRLYDPAWVAATNNLAAEKNILLLQAQQGEKDQHPDHFLHGPCFFLSPAPLLLLVLLTTVLNV
jgi:hypothetical protein